MNCNSTRKFLFAFADGQLGVQANCEVLDHLKMCPTCSAVVDEHQALREALRLSAQQIEVPAVLEGRVRKAILLGKSIRYHDGSHRWLQSRVVRLVGIAACLTLIVAGTWQYARWDASAHPPRFRDARALPEQQTALKVVRRHNRCITRSDRQVHQNPALPGDCAQVAEALRDHFGGRLLALAPDLSPYGFEFESANFCQLGGASGSEAAHVMYVDYSNGRYLSFFSMPLWDELDHLGRGGVPPTGERPFIHSVSPCDNMTVLAWDDRDTTYVCCGDVDPQQLLTIAQDIQRSME